MMYDLLFPSVMIDENAGDSSLAAAAGFASSAIQVQWNQSIKVDQIFVVSRDRHISLLDAGWSLKLVLMDCDKKIFTQPFLLFTHRDHQVKRWRRRRRRGKREDDEVEEEHERQRRCEQHWFVYFSTFVVGKWLTGARVVSAPFVTAATQYLDESRFDWTEFTMTKPGLQPRLNMYKRFLNSSR